MEDVAIVGAGQNVFSLISAFSCREEHAAGAELFWPDEKRIFLSTHPQALQAIRPCTLVRLKSAQRKAHLRPLSLQKL